MSHVQTEACQGGSRSNVRLLRALIPITNPLSQLDGSSNLCYSVMKRSQSVAIAWTSRETAFMILSSAPRRGRIKSLLSRWRRLSHRRPPSSTPRSSFRRSKSSPLSGACHSNGAFPFILLGLMKCMPLRRARSPRLH
jgi:hypothetical protein